MDNKSIDNFFNSLSKDDLKERWEKYNKYSEGGEGIPDPTAQLKADKEELLEALETVLHNSDVPNEIYDQSKNLLKKHKPCEIK